MVTKKEAFKKDKDAQPDNTMDRLKDLERMMKTRFGNNYHSVRKAFLAMDSDRDGFLDVENFLAYFINEKGINYDDLKKLLTDKDSEKRGMLNYKDFSRWMGNAIH